MEIKTLMLLSEAEDPTSAEPVLVRCDSEGSCLLLTIEKGERKANIFLWRDKDGRTWARITTAKDEQEGRLNKEIDLFEEDPALKPVAAEMPAMEERPATKVEIDTKGEEQPMPEADAIPQAEVVLEEEGIPDGVEIPF